MTRTEMINAIADILDDELSELPIDFVWRQPWRNKVAAIILDHIQPHAAPAVTDEMITAFQRTQEFSFGGYSREEIAEGIRAAFATR